MTEKAKHILDRMRETERRRRVLTRLNDPQIRAATLEQVNRVDQDPPAQVAKDHEMKVLNDINMLEEFQNENWSHGSL